MRKLLAACCFVLFAYITPTFAQTTILNPVTPLDGGQAVGSGNPLHVTGTFSASLGGFVPSLSYGTLTATASSSASTALPTNTGTVAFQNQNAAAVSCNLASGNTATATTNQLIVPAGSTIFVGTTGLGFAACIDQTGSASNVIIMAGGVGLGTGFGGGSSGGGGGNVTIVGPLGQAVAGSSVPVVLPAAQITTLTPPTSVGVNNFPATQPVSAASGAVNAGAYVAGALVAGALVDGASVTEGTKADSACASSSTSCTISSLLHGLLGAAQGANPVNVNGTVTAQTGVTPGVAQTGTIVAGNQDITSVGGKAVPKGGVPVINGGSTYQLFAASSGPTAFTGGGGGATGDYLSHCTVIPTSTSPGVVTILDNTTAIYSFPGGASSLSNLVPWAIPIGANSVSGGWHMTLGAGVSMVCEGKPT